MNKESGHYAKLASIDFSAKWQLVEKIIQKSSKIRDVDGEFLQRDYVVIRTPESVNYYCYDKSLYENLMPGISYSFYGKVCLKRGTSFFVLERAKVGALEI
jgi:hypothetical protein